MMTTAATITTASSPTAPVVLLIGLDAGGKPHGAAFGADDADLARKAAVLGGLHVLDLDGNDELRGLADKLARGKIQSSGAAFAPFVARKLFERLCAVGGVTPDALAKLRAATGAAPGDEPIEAAPEHHLPADWDSLKLGSLVLATEGDGEGWYEAVITKFDVDTQNAVLRWRDFSDFELFARHRDQLALLPPAAASA